MVPQALFSLHKHFTIEGAKNSKLVDWKESRIPWEAPVICMAGHSLLQDPLHLLPSSLETQRLQTLLSKMVLETQKSHLQLATVLGVCLGVRTDPHSQHDGGNPTDEDLGIQGNRAGMKGLIQEEHRMGKYSSGKMVFICFKNPLFEAF